MIIGESKMNNSKLINLKDNRIEIIRIIAIIFVILLHVTNRYLIKTININTFSNLFLIFINCITRISVPLFFMISGIVNIPKKFDKKKYFSRIFRMIIILIVWTIIYYFIGKYELTNLYHSIFSFLKPHLWYMYALIGLYIATPFISKMVKNLDETEQNLFIKLWLILSGIFYLFKVIIGLYGIDTNVTHPIPIFNATYYLGYYIIGYLIYNNYKKIEKYNSKLMILIIFISIVINTILTFLVSVNNNNYYQGFFGYSNILIIIPSIMFLIISLERIKDVEYKIINYICPYIFGIYLSHILILEYTMKIIKMPNLFLGCIVYAIITFAVSYALTYLIKKIPYINKYIC